MNVMIFHSYRILNLYLESLYRFPCVWNGTSILVLNEFIIDSPYDAVRSIRQAGPSNAEGLDRVIKVVCIDIILL